MINLMKLLKMLEDTTLTISQRISLKTLFKERLKEFKEPTLPKEIDEYLENNYSFYY